MKEFRKYLKQNKAKLMPIGIVVFLVIMTFISVALTRRSQELRSKALADTATLMFSPTSTSQAPGNTFNVSVLLTSTNIAVVGTDVLVQFDQSKLTLQNITTSTASNNTLKTFAPITSTGAFDINKVKTDANSTGIVEFGAVSFDYGAQTITTPFTGSQTLATLAFQVKTGATGSTAIQFKYDGATSTTDSNVVADPSLTGGSPEDILAAPTSTVAVTLSTTASPNPSTSPSTVCYDFNNSGLVDIQDILRVANRFNATTGSANYDALYDVNNDGRINITDIQRVANYWNRSCQ